MKSFEGQKRTLQAMNSAFILPKLTHASLTWSSSLNNTKLRQLERVQKWACGQIMFISCTTDKDILVRLQLRPIQGIYEFNLA